MGNFVIRTVPTGYKFDYKTLSAEVVATSEVYTTKAACCKGAQGVIASAPGAPVVDTDAGESAPNPKFELFSDKAGRYRFRLVARNGKIIAVSAAYRTREGCLRGIETVRAGVQGAEIQE